MNKIKKLALLTFRNFEAVIKSDHNRTSFLTLSTSVKLSDTRIIEFQILQHVRGICLYLSSHFHSNSVSVFGSASVESLFFYSHASLVIPLFHFLIQHVFQSTSINQCKSDSISNQNYCRWL